MSRRPLQDDEDRVERPTPVTPYFAAAPAPCRPLLDPERQAAVRAAQTLQAHAGFIGGHWDEHSAEEYAAAAMLYEEAAEAWDALGNESYAECARRAAELCKAKLEGLGK